MFGKNAVLAEIARAEALFATAVHLYWEEEP